MPLNIARGRRRWLAFDRRAAQRGRSTHVAGQRGRPNEEGAGQSYRGVLALFRALEGTRPADRRLLEDRFAAAFLSPRLRLVVGLSRVPLAGGIVRTYIDRRWPGARTSAVARTRFIDDAAEEARRSAVE